MTAADYQEACSGQHQHNPDSCNGPRVFESAAQGKKSGPDENGDDAFVDRTQDGLERVAGAGRKLGHESLPTAGLQECPEVRRRSKLLQEGLSHRSVARILDGIRCQINHPERQAEHPGDQEHVYWVLSHVVCLLAL